MRTSVDICLCMTSCFRVTVMMCVKMPLTGPLQVGGFGSDEVNINDIDIRITSVKKPSHPAQDITPIVLQPDAKLEVSCAHSRAHEIF